MADRRVGAGECVSHRIARGNEGAETKEKTFLIPTALSAWYFNFNLLPKGDESPRYHRLHAVWYFNFNLLPKGDESPRYHRLHAVWYFNFNLLRRGDPADTTRFRRLL